MSEEKFTIQEIRRWLEKQTFIDSELNKDGNEVLLFEVWTDDLTAKNIRKANEPPVNKHQIKLL